MNYQLLATDMDGTLLNAQKQISPANAAAINKALDMGKTVIFSTGRCIGELRIFLEQFPKMRYVLSESGACIYDYHEHRAIHQTTFPPETAKAIIDYAASQDIMMQVLADNQAFMLAKHLNNLAHFQMSHYQAHFDQNGVAVEDIYPCCEKVGWKLEKVCLYHPTAEARDHTAKVFEKMGLPVVMALAEETSLELSAQGVDKGVGLEQLCQYLNIPLEETIVVGDSFNDLSILKKAGLAVAVANAVPQVKEVCQVIVADCDHHGVKEAIDTYLLK
jgi:Cof subfamily protein (haloacid dehalogenase superfamily)